MTIKNTPVIATFLLLALAVPTFAFAGPGGHRGGGYGHGYDGRGGHARPALAPEKTEAGRKIMDDIRTKAEPLHRGISQRRAQLEYLSRSVKN